MRLDGRVQIGAWVLKPSGSGWVWGRSRPRVIKGQASEEIVSEKHFTGEEIAFVELFGAWVYEQRRLRGMTQPILAERSGVSLRTVQRIEARKVDPSMSTAVRLIRSLVR